jgi:hypothetical protein
MRKSALFVVLLGLTVMAQGAEAPGATATDDILQQYLRMPHPEKDRVGEARMARLAILTELSKQPDAWRSLRVALGKVKDPKKRKELVEVCGRNIQTKDSAILREEIGTRARLCSR